MATRDREHLVLSETSVSEPYSPYAAPRGGAAPPSPADPRTYGEGLLSQLDQAVDAGRDRRDESPIRVTGALDGIYMTFEGQPNAELALESLEPQQGRVRPELKSVRTVASDEGNLQQAVVFVPDSAVAKYVKRLQQYTSEMTQAGNPRHRNLVERIAAIKLATIEELWTETDEPFPDPASNVWWEVWLRRRDDLEFARFHLFADTVGLRLGERSLVFDDRVVILAYGSAITLASSLDALDDLAELRKPHIAAGFLADLPPTEQAEWIDDILARTAQPGPTSPSVAVLDTGVQRAHPLLELALPETDCHTCDPSWGTTDHDGHGTQMAGLALFGSLASVVSSSGPVQVGHGLESVKILPPTGHNEPRLYGALTAEAASRVEVEAPRRMRAYLMAVSAPTTSGVDNSGQPTAWSAAVDALAAGRGVIENDEGLVFLAPEDEDAPRRLIILSAGNVPQPLDVQHLDLSDLSPIEDPGQSWNALTVGAHTDLVDLGSSPDYKDWAALAPSGELSPFSRTSVAFARRWAIKPEVVCEGGNAAQSHNSDEVLTAAPLQVLTTAHLEGGRLFTTVDGTSPAAATAAHIAASVMADYPALWPESVRALIVHSAEWTERMRNAFGGASTRPQKVSLLRRYGMGVPSLTRATRSAADAVTLIAQETIRPFDHGKLREMNMHDLPWPTEELAALGETPVRLRVTLSYFITPNPARRGWVRRYSYASHGLWFDVRLPHESLIDFRKRLNRLALNEEEQRPSGRTDAEQWFFGPNERVRGSLHTDVWEGSAADLADRRHVAVYPVSGWWKERSDRDQSQAGVGYSLVVSIESPEVELDLWTPIAQQVGVPIEIQT
jgi:hypothetical protein